MFARMGTDLSKKEEDKPGNGELASARTQTYIGAQTVRGTEGEL